MIYQTIYTGSGTITDPFRPNGTQEQPAWTAIDLRDDATVVDGECIVDLPESPLILARKNMRRISADEAISIVRSRRGAKPIWLGNKLIQEGEEPALPPPLDPSDSFTQANGALSSSWSLVGSMSNLTVVSNAVRATSLSNHAGSYWNVDTPDPDQWSEITIKTTPSGSSDTVAASVRTATGANSCYYNQANTGATALWKMVNGSYTQLGTNGSNFATAGTIVRVRAISTTIKLNHDAAELISIGPESSLSSGRWGINIYCASTIANAEIESWQGGNEGAVAGQPTMKRFGGIPHMRQGHHSTW